MSESDAAVLAAARRIVAQQEAEAALAEEAKRAHAERLEESLKMALTRTGNDVSAAAGLFLAWCQQDSQVAKLLEPIITEAIERRLAAIPTAEPELA
jgi:hypothetical protein